MRNAIPRRDAETLEISAEKTLKHMVLAFSANARGQTRLSQGAPFAPRGQPGLSPVPPTRSYPTLNQKLSFHVAPGATLCNSWYSPSCARLNAFVIAAIGSKQI